VKGAAKGERKLGKRNEVGQYPIKNQKGEFNNLRNKGCKNLSKKKDSLKPGSHGRWPYRRTGYPLKKSGGTIGGKISGHGKIAHSPKTKVFWDDCLIGLCSDKKRPKRDIFTT